MVATVDQETPPLPDDVESLRALVVSMQQQLLEKDTALSAETAKRVTMAEHIALLKQQLAELRRMRFGRRSEKLDENIRQLEFSIEELETSAGEFNDTQQTEEQTQTPAKDKQRRSRKPLPDHLPRDVVTHGSNKVDVSAVESCANWVKMSARCWSIHRHHSAWFVMFGPATAAESARALRKLMHQADRLPEGVPDPGFWHMWR